MKTILAYAFFRGVQGVRHSHSKRFTRDGPGFDQRLPATAGLTLFLGEDRGNRPGGGRPKPAAPGNCERPVPSYWSVFAISGRRWSPFKPPGRPPTPKTRT